jgi:hypothetical protein
VKRALYGKLSGDSTLNALLGTPATDFAKAIYYQHAPRTAGFPYVIFMRQAGGPTEAMGVPSAFENDVWLVKGVDRSTSSDVAEAISARAQALLNDASLSISGATLCYLRRQSDVDYPETVDGVEYKHAGSLYRLITT